MQAAHGRTEDGHSGVLPALKPQARRGAGAVGEATAWAPARCCHTTILHACRCHTTVLHACRCPLPLPHAWRGTPSLRQGCLALLVQALVPLLLLQLQGLQLCLCQVYGYKFGLEYAQMLALVSEY